MEELLGSIKKFYRCKDIVYVILLPKIIQLYCTWDIRKYKWGNNNNRNTPIKTANGIKLNNGFDRHRKFLEDIYYGQTIAKKRFPLNYSLETRKFKKVLESENVEGTLQGALEETKEDVI